MEPKIFPRAAAKGAYAVLVAAILALLATSVVIVPAGYVGIVTQFGRVTGRELQPGLNVKLPWPVQGDQRFSVQIQKDQTSASAASADLQLVTATVAVNYHLDRGRVGAIFQDIGESYKERIIDPAIQESVKATTAKYVAGDLIVNRAALKDAVDASLAARLEPYGIKVDAVSIVNFSFSDEFNTAIEAKQVAQQKAEQAQYSLEQARKDAEAQAVQRDSLTPVLLEKQAIEKWDGKMPQYLGGGSVFNIPLTK